MDSKEYFEMFKKTGKISYYLKYKEEMAKEENIHEKVMNKSKEINMKITPLPPKKEKH